MKFIITFFFTVGSLIICKGQLDSCNSISFDALRAAVSTITLNNQKEKLDFVKYANFSFKDFKPVNGTVNPIDFYEIGFNSKHEIRQIVHVKSQWSIEYRSKFVVSDFDRFRVLHLLKKDSHFSSDYSFTPIIFLMMKTAGKTMVSNYAINVVPQFGRGDNNFESKLVYESFPAWSVATVSAIMALDEDFYPTRLVKLYDGYEVFNSGINYNKDRSVDYESAVVYLDRKPELKVDGSFCINQVMYLNVIPDMFFNLHPDVGTNKTAPLWIYGGAHGYAKCNE